MFSFFFHNDSRCCTIFVIYNHRAFRYKSLFPVIVCNFKTSCFQIITDTLLCMFILHQWKAHCLCCDFLCQIILCRTKTAS